MIRNKRLAYRWIGEYLYGGVETPENLEIDENNIFFVKALIENVETERKSSYEKWLEILHRSLIKQDNITNLKYGCVLDTHIKFKPRNQYLADAIWDEDVQLVPIAEELLSIIDKFKPETSTPKLKTEAAVGWHALKESNEFSKYHDIMMRYLKDQNRPIYMIEISVPAIYDEVISSTVSRRSLLSNRDKWERSIFDFVKYELERLYQYLIDLDEDKNDSIYIIMFNTGSYSEEYSGQGQISDELRSKLCTTWKSFLADLESLRCLREKYNIVSSKVIGVYCETVHSLQDKEEMEYESFHNKSNSPLVSTAAAAFNVSTKYNSDVIRSLEDNVMIPSFHESLGNYKISKYTSHVYFYGGGHDKLDLMKDLINHWIFTHCVNGSSPPTTILVNARHLESSAYGETEKKWRDLFKKVRNMKRVMLLVEGMDQVLRERTEDDADGLSSYRRRLVSTILTAVDGVSTCSNHQMLILGLGDMPPDKLDSAAMRPGRFSKWIEFR